MLSSTNSGSGRTPDMARPDPTNDAILVLGAPRSGTTWLAKILDSHPDVLYRHEPDEVVPHDPTADSLRMLRAWAAARTLRASAKRPFFRKSFLSPARAMLRSAVAHALSGASRLPGAARPLAQIPIPDFISADRAQNLRITLKLVNWDATPVARALPDSRHLFILRHPCGQIASALQGVTQGHFGRKSGGDAEAYDDAEHAAAFAATRGVSPRAFAALPASAKFAWSWCAFNETALDGLENLHNVRVVIYENLCVSPDTIARDLFAFAGLSWHSQTEAFLSHSSNHDGKAGYFEVLRSSAAAATQWRDRMSPDDRHAVYDVVRHSRLAQNWPDIIEGS
jgi:hypothetical protein